MLILRSIRVAIKNYKTLSLKYGQFFSTLKWSAINRDGQPLPWYTYPAIEYLSQFDFSKKTIFEFGSGNSTLFWANRALKVFAVESNKLWYEKMKIKLPQNVVYYFCESKSNFLNSIKRHENIDVIIIDGPFRDECAEVALNKINPNGMIIFDNSDRNQPGLKLLSKDKRFIQIDMFGFGPMNGCTWVTSLFISRKFNFKRAAHLIKGIGNINNEYEKL